MQPPQSLVGYEKGAGNIQLNWWGGANDTNYKVYPVPRGGAIHADRQRHHRLHVHRQQPARRHVYYKVTGVEGATETAATNVVATSSNVLFRS